MSRLLSALAVVALLLTTNGVFAQDIPPAAEKIELERSNKARSKYVSLHKQLGRLRGQFEEQDGRQAATSLKNALRDLDAAQSKNANLDLSAEKAELDVYTVLVGDLVELQKRTVARDKVLKKFDKEVTKLESFIEKAATRKSKPEKFESGYDKAAKLLADAAEADPDYDVSANEAVLEGFRADYQIAAAGFIELQTFGTLDKALAKLAKEVETVGYAVEKLDSKEQRALDNGEPLTIERVEKARQVFAKIFETKQTEKPNLDFSKVESQLASIDADIADLYARNTDAAVSEYFDDKGTEIDNFIASVTQINESGNNRYDSDFDAPRESLAMLGALLDRAETDYPEAKTGDLKERHADLTKRLASAGALNTKVREAYDYFTKAGGTLGYIARSGPDDIAYSSDTIFQSGIESFDVAELRERLAVPETQAVHSRQAVAEAVRMIDASASGNTFVDGVKRLIKQSNDKNRSSVDRQNNLNSAKRIAGIAKKFRPEDDRYDTLINQVEKRIAALQEQDVVQAAAASTGELHLSKIDRIVFHSAPLTIGNEDESLISDSFVAGTPIYGTAYLSQSLLDLSRNGDNPDRIDLEMSISGDQCGGYPTGRVQNIARDQMGQTYLQFALFPALDGYEYEHLNDAHLTFVQCQELNATVGDEPVVVRLGLRDMKTGGEDSLTGSFMLTYDSGANERIAATLASLTEMRIDATRLPEARMEDSALEALMLDNAQYVDGEPVRAVLSRERWSVFKNELDIPTSQMLYGHLAVKTAEGRCFFQEVAIEAIYVGGAYGAARADGPKGPAREIRCENI